MNKTLICLFLLGFINTGLKSEYLYRDFLTGFADLSSFNTSSGHIVLENQDSTAIFDTYCFNTSKKDFSYQIRLKNEPLQGNNAFLQQHLPPAHGVVWNFKDTSNYYAIELKPINDQPYDDITGRQYIEINIFSIENGTRNNLFKTELEKGINLDGNYNTVRLSFSGQIMKIGIGEKELADIAELPGSNLNPSNRIGYYTTSGGRLTVKRIQYNDMPQKETSYNTAWTNEQVDSLVRNCTDPNVGYWTYLDRNMDEHHMRLGGKYKIALLKTNEGYQILYLEGAKLYPKIWKPLMEKGFLKETPFLNHYDLVWHDAQKQDIKDESYAVFSGNGFLTFYFPLKKSEIRFFKAGK